MTSFEKAIQDPRVDIVYLGTPPSEHHKQMESALKAKKAVLCEKPFTLNTKQAKDVYNLSLEQKAFLMEALFTRYVPGFSALKEIIHSKIYGSIKSIDSSITIEKTPKNAPALFNETLGGGAIGAVLVYPIHLTYFLLGKPTKIVSSGKIGSTNVDESCEATLTYAENVKSTFFGSIINSSNSVGKAVIHCEKATITIPEKFWCVPELVVTNETNDVIFQKKFPMLGNGYVYEAIEIREKMQQGLLESPGCTLADSIAVMEIVDEIRKQIQNS